ncbi:hypothetical protein [Dictyobacter arantiisoli]|uniref:Uncharacterized protein n=1 Tax=Dictyobacter arantiisoli TaxID=2014874 RepID=A0A5A5T7P1_9CHLR|nr:hypothetical protein [Dictyobacter arantiisoli]GCF06944.1 hypothetical protein KDI_05080 [Dictyobacter arantiisoli]
MCKQKKQQSNILARVASPGQSYIIWGSLALVGAAFLCIINIVFIYASYKSAHPTLNLTLSDVLILLSGPLIIAGLLALIGIAAIIFGIKQHKHG